MGNLLRFAEAPIEHKITKYRHNIEPNVNARSKQKQQKNEEKKNAVSLQFR